MKMGARQLRAGRNFTPTFSRTTRVFARDFASHIDSSVSPDIVRWTPCRAELRRKPTNFRLWTLAFGLYPNPDQLRLTSTKYGLKIKITKRTHFRISKISCKHSGFCLKPIKPKTKTNPFHAADAFTRTFQSTNSPMPSATPPTVPTIVPSRAQSCPVVPSRAQSCPIVPKNLDFRFRGMFLPSTLRFIPLPLIPLPSLVSRFAAGEEFCPQNFSFPLLLSVPRLL